MRSKTKGYIYYWHYHALLILSSIKAAMHSHYAMEIYIGLENTFKIDFGKGWEEYRAVIIDSNQPHQFDGTDGWYALLMMNPSISAAYNLRENIMHNKKFKELSIDPLRPYIKELLNYQHNAFSCKDAELLLDSILKSLTIETIENESLDPRITEVYKILRELPEKKISAKKIAELINISESRLAHLFKKETGIPIRRFLLWLKTMEALKHIFNGISFTESAYEAGFSDSAHLSRTYKEMFGLPPSDLLNNLPDIQIISCIN